MADSIVIVSLPARPWAACWATSPPSPRWELGAVAIQAAVERAGVPGDAGR
jgi:acetyl-CoA C-acetyltransferase